jgi:hypothetical protein
LVFKVLFWKEILFILSAFIIANAESLSRVWDERQNLERKTLGHKIGEVKTIES